MKAAVGIAPEGIVTRWFALDAAASAYAALAPAEIVDRTMVAA
jgi:hypothetical protein